MRGWTSERFQVLVRSRNVVVVASGPMTARLIAASDADYRRGMRDAEEALRALSLSAYRTETRRIPVCDFALRRGR